ncbi:MAG: glutamate formimidoyltransferase [Candidatus Hatepunaea meridiana]|nr:glutamate formimidoyltransferase [Candidatus Hatepunaea meridiana]
MPPIVECVPNISEGRDKAIIDTVINEIETVPGVTLLDVDPGEDTNRTVITFVGDPDSVVESALKVIAKAAELIDLNKQQGAHARMGATDVCPFVPVSGVTMDDCVELARRLGKRVGEELGIPVYLYEYAASRPERINLADCRAGEFEGLKAREGNEYWKPDYGPFKFGTAGATAVSARDFLIAWNVNLNTKDTKIASRIANRLREKGYAKMDPKNPKKYLRDEEGNVIFQPGKFKDVKAVGWYIDKYKQAQISVNLINYHVSPPHLVFDEACKLADQLGVRVTGSELVGVIPLEAMRQAGTHFLKKQGVITGVNEEDIIRCAIQSMGLDQISPFDPDKNIIEYMIRKPGLLTSMKITKFIDELASDSPAPGGGSVAAMCGGLSAALASMVANLTYGKKGYTKYNDLMDEMAVKAQELKAKLIDYIDKDTEAFNKVMDAMRMPKKTPEQQEARNKAIDEANRGATLIPFEVLSTIPDIIKLAKIAAQYGNKNLTPDAGVAGLTSALAARGAAYNVRVNLQNLPDNEFSRKLKEDTDRILKEVDDIAAEIREVIEGRLWG